MGPATHCFHKVRTADPTYRFVCRWVDDLTRDSVWDPGPCLVVPRVELGLVDANLHWWVHSGRIFLSEVHSTVRIFSLSDDTRPTGISGPEIRVVPVG